jgi:hypothetical protein
VQRDRDKASRRRFFATALSLSLSFSLSINLQPNFSLTFSPFLGVGATLSSGATVVEGVEARVATTEEGEETRTRGDAASLAGDERRAARGTMAALQPLLPLVDAAPRQAAEAREDEDASVVDCIFSVGRGGEKNEREEEEGRRRKK